MAEGEDDLPTTTAHEQQRRSSPPTPTPSSIPILPADSRRSTPSLSIYSSINGRTPPTVSPRSSSISILACSPDDDAEYDSSDSDAEDFRRRQEETLDLILSERTSVAGSSHSAALSSRSPQIFFSADEQSTDDDAEDPPSLIPHHHHCRNGSRSTARRIPSPPPPRSVHRKAPHPPPGIPLRLSNPPRRPAVSFKPKVRVHGGIKPHKARRSGQKPMPRITCAADHLRLNLLETNPRRQSSFEAGPSRPFYLASHQSNPSSANSSCVSFDHPINFHSYVPEPLAHRPRQIVLPPPRIPPPSPNPKEFTPAEDWMYQRLLDGYDSDDDSQWSWHEESDDDENADERWDDVMQHTPLERIRRAEWTAREDALVLRAHVSTWTSKLEASPTETVQPSELLSAYAPKRPRPTGVLPLSSSIRQLSSQSVITRPKSSLARPATRRAHSEERHIPHPVRFDAKVKVRQVPMEEEESPIWSFARAVVTGMGISWGPTEYDEDLKANPSMASGRQRRRSTA